MADVIALPGAVPAPVLQQRRRGRLPKGIGSLQQALRRRALAELEHARAKECDEVAARPDTVHKIFGGLECMARDGEVTGALMVYERNGKLYTLRVGSLAASTAAIRAAETLQASVLD